MNKCVVLFVEGDTEIEFYKKVISDAREMLPHKRLEVHIECCNVRGVGGFKNIALRKFLKQVKPKYGDHCVFTIVLCSDTDVFDFSPKPPINWKETKKDFVKAGALEVIHIQARHSIEDWFLEDTEGVIAFLKLPKRTKVSGKNGYQKLQRLYKLANKVYYKGATSNGLIERLNIRKITESVKHELVPLYFALGVSVERMTD